MMKNTRIGYANEQFSHWLKFHILVLESISFMHKNSFFLLSLSVIFSSSSFITLVWTTQHRTDSFENSTRNEFLSTNVFLSHDYFHHRFDQSYSINEYRCAFKSIICPTKTMDIQYMAFTWSSTIIENTHSWWSSIWISDRWWTYGTSNARTSSSFLSGIESLKITTTKISDVLFLSSRIKWKIQSNEIFYK